MIRKLSLEKSSILYLTYKFVLESKTECYPNNIKITENGATVELQALLDHIAQRILSFQSEVIKNLSAEKIQGLYLICKWGYDGTSSQSNYKQKCINEETYDENFFHFSCLLQVSFVAIGKKTNIIVYKNPRPSSPRFCRPIKINF